MTLMRDFRRTQGTVQPSCKILQLSASGSLGAGLPNLRRKGVVEHRVDLERAAVELNAKGCVTNEAKLQGCYLAPKISLAAITVLL